MAIECGADDSIRPGRLRQRSSILTDAKVACNLVFSNSL